MYTKLCFSSPLVETRPLLVLDRSEIDTDQRLLGGGGGEEEEKQHFRKQEVKAGNFLMIVITHRSALIFVMRSLIKILR